MFTPNAETTTIMASEPPSVAAEIGRRIAQYRKAAGLTQEQLGELSGHHKQSISDWERGERTPYVDSLASIASALGVSMDTLVYGTVPEEHTTSILEQKTEDIVAYLRLAERLLRAAPIDVRQQVNGVLSGIEMTLREDTT